MEIVKFTGGSIMSNGYIVYVSGSEDAYIIDPGFNARRFIDFINARRLRLKGVLLTHHHYDHTDAAEKIINEFGCEAYIHEADAPYLKFPVTPFKDGQKFTLPGIDAVAVNTPGHTKGGVIYCFSTGDYFTGDTIFDTDIGRTDLSDGQPYGMARSIQNIIEKWPDDIRIHPGHGGDSTMGEVRKNNREYIFALTVDTRGHEGE